MSAPAAVHDPANRGVISGIILRDGERSPGRSVRIAENPRVVHVPEELGVDVIGAGLPTRLERPLRCRV